MNNDAEKMIGEAMESAHSFGEQIGYHIGSIEACIEELDTAFIEGSQLEEIYGDTLRELKSHVASLAKMFS